jgi:hypothetical protein
MHMLDGLTTKLRQRAQTLLPAHSIGTEHLLFCYGLFGLGSASERLSGCDSLVIGSRFCSSLSSREEEGGTARTHYGDFEALFQVDTPEFTRAIDGPQY